MSGMRQRGVKPEAGGQVLVLGVVRLEPGAAHRLRGAAETFALLSRAERGCLDFDLHVSEAGVVATIEWWRDARAAAAHQRAGHTRLFLALLEGFAAPRGPTHRG
jgi:quinol monooxygenase YgiN